MGGCGRGGGPRWRWRGVPRLRAGAGGWARLWPRRRKRIGGRDSFGGNAEGRGGGGGFPPSKVWERLEEELPLALEDDGTSPLRRRLRSATFRTWPSTVAVQGLREPEAFGEVRNVADRPPKVSRPPPPPPVPRFRERRLEARSSRWSGAAAPARTPEGAGTSPASPSRPRFGVRGFFPRKVFAALESLVSRIKTF